MPSGPRTVEVPSYEISRSVAVDPGTTALVILDMQRDFVSEHGCLPVPGAADVIAPIRRLLAWARRVGMAVVFARDSHRDGDPDWDLWGRHAAEGSPGWRLVDELAPRPTELVLPKLRADAFYGTPLDHDLRLLGVDTLILCGASPQGGLAATGAAAGMRWYRVVVPVDALATPTAFDREVVLVQAAQIYQGLVTTTDALLGSSPEN